MLFYRNFCEKWQIWVSEVRGDAWPWLIARWKAHGGPFIRLNWTFFTIYYGFGAMRRNVYSLAVFAGASTSLHSNFTWTGSSPSPHQPFWTSENLRHWAIWLWRPHPSAFPRFDTIPECDGWTDGCAIAYAALAKLAACCKNLRQVYHTHYLYNSNPPRMMRFLVN